MQKDENLVDGVDCTHRLPQLGTRCREVIGSLLDIFRDVSA